MQFYAISALKQSILEKQAVIREVKGKTKQQREVEEQKIIFKLDCVNQGLNRDYSFMSNYV